MTLLPFERDWAQTLGRALVPAGVLDGATDGIDLGARFAEECAVSPWYAALAFRASLWLAWLSPLWMLRRPHTFGGVDAAAQTALLESLLKHRVYTVRMAVFMLKLSICTLAFGDESTLARIGAYKLTAPAQLTRKVS